MSRRRIAGDATARDGGNPVAFRIGEKFANARKLRCAYQRTAIVVRQVTGTLTSTVRRLAVKDDVNENELVAT